MQLLALMARSTSAVNAVNQYCLHLETLTNKWHPPVLKPPSPQPEGGFSFFTILLSLRNPKNSSERFYLLEIRVFCSTALVGTGRRSKRCQRAITSSPIWVDRRISTWSYTKSHKARRLYQALCPRIAFTQKESPLTRTGITGFEQLVVHSASKSICGLRYTPYKG